ncbi:MAG: hypothetical protein IKU85_09255 [Bacteroidaceae bacterium]|nr:hypothetical protein [Bacteroidaceae bacterium]
MKKFIIRVSTFILLVAILDALFGFAMGRISERIDIGGTGRDNNICDKITDDIIVFGSSRAEHHYNAQMISDSLGQSCYNAGEDGCGIILAYGRLLMLLDRYTPKTILYEITPSFDYLHEGKDYHKYLYKLKRHYDRNGIDSIFWDVDRTERYKMQSGTYQHNSSFLQNLIVYFLGISTDIGIKGYRPLNGEMDTMKIKSGKLAYDSSNGYRYDPFKMQYLHKFLQKSEGQNLIFVVSPMWYEMDTLVLEPIKEICKEHDIPLIDFSNDPKYVHNNRYFKDGTHLNAIGADEFTHDLIKELRKQKVFQY